MRSYFFMLILLAIAASSARAQTVPVVINPETGNEVNLTRVYWNANVDLANRTLTCEWYALDRNTGQSTQLYDPLTYDHSPLPAVTPSLSSAQVYSNGVPTNRGWGLFDPSRAWSVSDGIYSGPMPLHLSPFVEEIAHNSDTINAVRIWNDRYGSFICFDASGDSLLPTGSASTGNTNLVDPEDFTFEFPKVPSEDIVIPELYTLTTGEKVELVRGEWSYSDVANHMILCSARYFDGEEYGGAPDSALSFYFPYYGDDTVTVSSRGQDIEFWQIDDMSVEDISLPPPRPGYQFMELTETGYRMWAANNESYYECTIKSFTGVSGSGVVESQFDQISPVTVLPLGRGHCDYSDSDQHDGWGWNAVTRASCPPLTTPVDNCDYTDAAQNDGWGWNTVADESCPPKPNLPEPLGNCDYTSAAQNDGWGWNSVTEQSCPPGSPIEQPPVCEDTDGDGYGWDGVDTCVP